MIDTQHRYGHDADRLEFSVPAIEAVVEPLGAVTLDQERYDRTLLMSHLCAYQKAAQYAQGRRFLEIGCGSGYGAYYLSHVAEHVTAIDMEPTLIEQARRLFQRPNLEYRNERVSTLPLRDASMDCVGAFQVIEHIPEPQLPAFVRDIARVLVPGGVFVVSTLNLAHNKKHSGYQKASFHEKEFTPPELEALLRTAFPHVEVLGLYPRARYRLFLRLKRWGLSCWGSGARNPVQRFFAKGLSTRDHVLRNSCTPSAIDIIAICRT